MRSKARQATCLNSSGSWMNFLSHWARKNKGTLTEEVTVPRLQTYVPNFIYIFSQVEKWVAGINPVITKSGFALKHPTILTGYAN
jgi:hypothetical protein